MADEPTGNLDSRTSREVTDLFRELNADHEITLILVTHDQGVAQKATRNIVLHDGRVAVDTTDFAVARRALERDTIETNS